MRRILIAMMLLFAGPATLTQLSGCTCDSCEKTREVTIWDTSTPGKTLEALTVAYTRRDIALYADLLSDDFRFYFDEATRVKFGLPEFWNRSEDSTCTEALFNAPDITGLRIALQFGADRAAEGEGREMWRKVEVLDTFVEIDVEREAGQQEGITYRIDGQQNVFYFRKGRSPADTAAVSLTAAHYYIVRWEDGAEGGCAPGRPECASSTWSRLKTLRCR